MPVQSPLNLEESLLVIEVLDEALSKQNYLKLTMNTVKKKKIFFSGISTTALQKFFYSNLVDVNWLICKEIREHKR